MTKRERIGLVLNQQAGADIMANVIENASNKLLALWNKKMRHGGVFFTGSDLVTFNECARILHEELAKIGREPEWDPDTASMLRIVSAAKVYGSSYGNSGSH
jgi:hypothetical protein